MSISEKDVIYVADLANLELTPDERTRFARELGSILDYIGRLNELDTENVPPMAQVSARQSDQNSGGQFAHAQRDDVVQPCLPRETAMQNAPIPDGTFFKVPKVIER